MTSGTPTRMASWLESAWLARYLERQLNGEEEAWFEAYMFDKPELLEMVETDNALRYALAAEPVAWRVTKPGVHASNARDMSDPSKQFTNRTATRRSALSGIAAAAVLVIGLGLGWIGGRSHQDGHAPPAVIASPTRIVYDTQRGAPSSPIIDHASSDADYVLIEVAIPFDATQIRVQLSDGNEHSLIQSSDGFVSFLAAKAVISSHASITLRYELAGRTIERDISIKRQLMGELK